MEFNAQRIWDPRRPIEVLQELKLLEFSGMDDDGKFLQNTDPQQLINANYGCGFYRFTRNGALKRRHTTLHPSILESCPCPRILGANWKCGYKALLYMAMGKPVAVSPVRVNSEIVRHGINGYHASNSTEWTQYRDTLLQDAALRARLGSPGRQLVADEYCIRAVLPRCFAVLRGDLEMARESGQIPKFAEDRS